MLFVDVENGNGLPASIVTSSGAVSFNTSAQRGELSLFYVNPTTPTTQYDVQIIDRRGRIVRWYQKQTGTLRDEAKVGMQGKYTISILNATADEAFQVHMKIMEIHS